MSNINFCVNQNNFNPSPSFCQNNKSLQTQEHMESDLVQHDLLLLSNKKEKEKEKEKSSFFSSFLKGFMMTAGVTLGLFCGYKIIEYFKPGFFKKIFNSQNKESKPIVEKSKQERTFLQKFNIHFKNYNGTSQEIEKLETDFVLNGVKNREITEEQKEKFFVKIKSRKKIRDFNSEYKTHIPLTPYGGVESLVEAYDKIRNDKEAKKVFNEILDNKIEKIENKIKVLENQKLDSKTLSKMDRTNDLLCSFRAIKKNLDKENFYYVDYQNHIIKNEIKQKSLYKTSLKNELGTTTYYINLSTETFKALFGEGNDMLEQQAEDCYLVGTLNAIINNPEKRCEFYSMFSEDDKSIKFEFKNGFYVVFPKTEDGKPESLYKNNLSSLKGAMGYKMFEEAYLLYRLYHENTTEENKKEIKDFSTNPIKSSDDFKYILRKLRKNDEKGGGYYHDHFGHLIDGGSIHEVAASLFDVDTKGYCLQGFEKTKESDNTPPKKLSDKDLSEVLEELIKDKKSVVVGRDKEDKYDYNGVPIAGRHFFVIRYYNPKTKEVHLFESNEPSKILILPLSVFNKEYGVLYGF